jgi:hypothetical protein
LSFGIPAPPLSLLLSHISKADRIVDETKAAIQNIGKVGRTRALDLGAKGLFKRTMQKGELMVGQVDGGDGIIVVGRAVEVKKMNRMSECMYIELTTAILKGEHKRTKRTRNDSRASSQAG